MALPLIPCLALTLLFSLFVYKYIIHPAFLSRLSKLPAIHWSAHISPLWILNKRRREQDTPAVHQAHEKYGPIVRLAPNEISVNSVEGGLRTIYAGGYEKGDWYYNAFNNYGIMPMFAMPDRTDHSKRRRLLSNVYAKSTLQSSEGLERITQHMLNDRLAPRLREAAEKGEGLEMYHVFSAVATDFVAAYVFGLAQGCDYTRQPEMGAKFFKDFKTRQRFQFWGQEVPGFTKLLAMVGLKGLVVPDWVGKASNDIEAWILSLCDAAEKVVRRADVEGEKGRPEDWPTVYAQLRNALVKEEKQTTSKEIDVDAFAHQNRRLIASEMLDHTLAGFDTSSITLAFLAYELSLPNNSHWQDRLRDELSTLNGSRDAKSLDNLPILHAIIMETLRLHAAIPGNQPRITPANATLGAPGHELTDLPPNVRVQSQAWSLHRNPSVFPEPETWNPARWIESSEEQLKEMQRWFWAFGSGGRMCVGSNLAMLDMKAIIAGVWGVWRTSLLEGRGMRHNGGYIAEPVGYQGKWCFVKVEEVKQ